jgi:hypothetical protein
MNVSVGLEIESVSDDQPVLRVEPPASTVNIQSEKDLRARDLPL